MISVDGVCLKLLGLLLINVIKIVTLDLANVLNLFVLLTIGFLDLRDLVMMPCKEVEESVPLFLL